MEEDLEIELLAKQAVLGHGLLPIFGKNLLPVNPTLLTDYNRPDLTNDTLGKRTTHLPVQQGTKNVGIADHNSIVTSKKLAMNKVSFVTTCKSSDI
jgi:hypothetical protein